jgi:hypothetical protein
VSKDFDDIKMQVTTIKKGYVYFKIACPFRPERQQIILRTIVIPFKVSYFRRLEIYAVVFSSTCSNTGKQTQEV